MTRKDHKNRREQHKERTLPPTSGGDLPLPEGWQKRYFEVADLDESYRELEGIDHFYVSALRGLISSQKLEFDQAWDHFDKACDQAEDAEETIPNLVRQFLLEIWRFECALAEGPVDPDARYAADTLPPIPHIPNAVLEDFPEVRYVLNQRRFSEALLKLHTGDCFGAASIFKEILRENPDTKPEILFECYTGLAACMESIGLLEEMQRNLYCAELATQVVGWTLNAVQQSARLIAFYRFLDEPEHAKEWEGFLERLTCPQATKDVFLQRCEKLFERSGEAGRLLVF
jgi:hypothetical protein